MAHAWLDSLSEDWVSEPRSDASEAQLPPLKPLTDTTPSKIPRRTGANPVYSPVTGNSSHILNERSANEINISQHKLPSRLSQELKLDSKASRSVSAATCGSVVHKSEDSQNAKEGTPEWKRRLINGEVPYGEQRDLFCSAGTGLQDMFKPPQADLAETQYGQAMPDRTLPSSPPQHQYEPDEDIDRLLELAEEDDHDFPEQVTPSPSPRRANRSTHFRSTSNGNNSFLPSLPMDNFVDESPLQHGGIARNKVLLNAPQPAHGSFRQVSGQTDIDNEDFSPIMIGRQDEEDGPVKFGAMDIPVSELQLKLERVQESQAHDAEDNSLYLGATVDRESEMDALHRFTSNAGQINLRRGGRSGDGSFYTRALSPDLGVDTSEMLPEESLQASTPKEFLTIRTELPSRGASQSMGSPIMPRAPFPSPDKRSMNPSGSPLKLFGPYDTFTNQTLLRRISQYEDVDSADSSGHVSPDKPDSIDESRRSVSYFGGGQLDNYEFAADMSETHDLFQGTDKENVSPEAHMIPMGSRRHLSFGNVSKLLISRRRERSVASTDVVVEALRPTITMDAPELRDTSGRDHEAYDAKRTSNSPIKDPTPKRRRTLRRSDATHNRQEQLSQVDVAHQQMQHAMGKKRKDARPGQFRIAEADVLAARKILKPCSPASSRKSSQEFDDSLNEANLTGGGRTETDRKPSIKTQDFVDQAAQIMAMIRSQVKPTGLASLEESEEEHNTGADGEIEPAEGSQPDSTYEPLSRPPSREGKQSPNYQERSNDPDLEARLKKYKEMSDMGDLATSSMRSVGMVQDVLRGAHIDSPIRQATFGRPAAPLPMSDHIVSDLANVRISGPFLDSSSPARGYPSNSSAHSANTIPTSSSTNSDTRRTIMPESVSHLIPDRVGSMFLDKSQNIWIKKKEAKSDAQNNSIAATEDSEEDPFASIPDLTVDMTQELRNLRRGMDDGRGLGVAGPQSSPLHHPPQAVLIPSSPDQGDEDIEELPRTEKPETQQGYDSRNGTAKRRNMTISFSSPIASIIQEAMAMGADSVDGEVTPRSINYDQSPDQSPPDNFSGKAALRQTENKSRPPTMRYASQQGPDFVRRPVSPINEQDEDSTVELLANEANQLSIVREQGLTSYGGQESRHASLSVIFSRTPGNKSLALVGDESTIIGQNIGHMSLSPLSDFNVNQGDQSFGFEVSYVLGNRHLSTGDGSKKVMSLTLRELVERLSEVEPCEPYWQDIEELNLSEKRLSSLHMLEEFCGKVVTLDASQNALGHLEGVPSSVRQLKVSQNMLTELTSWNHLVNLQYVDISGNEVKSLSALRNLVHLRSVKADNNKLTSLDGLDSHEGLLSLRARGNLIEELDFEDSAFGRLTELDLAGNRIEVVRNVDLAPCLSKLKLSNNKLQTFEASKSCKMIRHLDVSQNRLWQLDVSSLPNLHTLLADGNQLPSVTGLQRTRRLDSLSLREQRGQEPLNLGFLSVGYEVRKLYLSGNYLESFEPKVDMLNLQLLELANCGLTCLPVNVGQLMPNLRSLNINFNAISNVKPLQYIPRLKKLMMAGNRLTDSTSVTQLLMDFPHLTRLDTRDNPMTLGFYAPLQALVKTTGNDTTPPFALPDADEERDGLYVSRLDEPTKLRRRLHQVVLAASCSRLRMLDGLPMRRKHVLTMDSLLTALVEEGLVEVPGQTEEREGTREVCEEKTKEECEQRQSSR